MGCESISQRRERTSVWMLSVRMKRVLLSGSGLLVLAKAAQNSATSIINLTFVYLYEVISKWLIVVVLLDSRVGRVGWILRVDIFRQRLLHLHYSYNFSRLGVNDWVVGNID